MADLFAEANVPEDEVDMIVGTNAIAIMGFDAAKLAQTPAAKIPWPDPEPATN